MNRRTFIVAAAGAARLPSTEPSSVATRAQLRRPKAIVFDGFPIIDPRPVAARAEEMFPGQGASVMNTWRIRQFEYTWLRTLAGQYVDFWSVTQDALVFAGRSLGLALDAPRRARLMNAYLELGAWPDVRLALERIRAAGIRMAFLSNFTTHMLDAALANASLSAYFEPHLTTDRVRAFKPDPRAYSMALEAFEATREDIVFCAGAGWDAAGARYFGYRTFWLNRQLQPPEEMGIAPDGIGAGMPQLVDFLAAA